MALDTYTNLKTEIAEHLRRDATAFSSKIDTFIDLAEERHRDEIRLREMLERTSITISARQTSLPSDFLQVKTLKLLTSPVTPLKQLSPDIMDEYRREENGRPCYFAIHKEIEVDVVPDEAYSGEMLYYKQVAALSDSNASNEILARAPGLYLYGALTFSAPYVDDLRLQEWNTIYENLRDGLGNADRKSRHSGPKKMRVKGFVV